MNNHVNVFLNIRKMAEFQLVKADYFEANYCWTSGINQKKRKKENENEVKKLAECKNNSMNTNSLICEGI